ncbi:MAG TPA: histidine kinase [Naasia sp.]
MSSETIAAERSPAALPTRPGPAARAVLFAAIALVTASTLFALVSDILVARAGQLYPLDTGWSGVLPGVALAIPGALLFLRMPWHPIASILLGFGVLWAVDGAASAWVNLSLAFDLGLPGLEFAVWYFSRFGAVLVLPFILLLLLFPDGRLPRRQPWRAIGWVGVLSGLVMPTLAQFFPPNASGVFGNSPAPDPRLLELDTIWVRTPLSTETWDAVGQIVPISLLVSGLSAFVVIISRWIGADVTRRRQLRWLIWSGVLLFLLGLVAEAMPPSWISTVLFTATLCLVCFSVLIAVTRYKLYAIDSLFSWTLVYAVLVGGILAVDAAIVALAGSVIGQQGSALLAVVLVGLAFAPMRNALFRLASRLIAGRRVDPYGVVTRLAARLETVHGLSAQLEAIAEAVADAFASPSVEVRVERVGVPAAAALFGTAADRPVEFPLEYRGVAIGRIRMAPGRRPVLTDRDQRLLGVVIRQAAAAASAAQAGEELRRIRRELVLSREAERLRLRRDLHDGLGPLVASVRLRLETAGNLLDADPAAAAELLEGAAADSAEAVADVRRIVDDLRPPVLDQLGVAGAIEAQAGRFHAGSGRVHTSVQLSGALPAAVEIAAYRIVSEALANAARHSGATRVDIEVRGTPEGVTLRVSDDGVGLPETLRAGTGLASQRERAEELGGTWAIGPGPDGGTRVEAWLPAQRTTEREMANVG